MKKSQSLIWLITAILFAIGATVLILSYMVTDPGHVIVQLGGDCGKNYFTYLYHAIYGNGVWFEGMNYPYGEHIIYADGQPVLSSLLNQVKGLKLQQALAIMNLAISFSYVLAIVFTYKILNRFGVKPFIAILFACLINLCAPQVLRARAHFALAYLCAIPMLFYWSILYHYTQQWKWAVYIFIMGFIMAFLHLYTGAIIFIWVAFYTLGYLLLIKGPIAEKVKHVTPLLISAASLFVLIKVCIALTDPVKDRPAFPLNTLDYVTRIKDIITSPYSPLSQYMLRQKWIPKVTDAGEGFTYLGVAVILAVFASVIIGIVKMLQKKSGDDFIVSEHGFSPVWLFIAGGALCMAMGIPFIWNMQWLLNYLSLFKQFRAMGRFSWVFYYISAIFGALVIYTFYARCIAKRRFAAGYGILVTALLLWSIDSKGIISFTRDYIANGRPTYDEFAYKGQQTMKEYFTAQHFKGDDFQGVILLPFFASGSEKLWVGGDPSWPLSVGMRAALDLHLPIVDIMMSRTSWSVTGKQVKTMAGPYADKPMLRDLKSNKPFLLFQFEGMEIDADQQYLLKASDFIGQHFQSYIYACYPDRIRANDKKYADSVAAILPFWVGGDTSLRDNGIWYTDHFDKQSGSERLAGTGALPVVRKDSFVLAEIAVKPLWENMPYEFSCWFLLDDKDYRSPYVNLQQMDSAHNQITSIDALTKQSMDNKGMWFRASTYLNLHKDCRSLRCVIVNTPDPTYIAVDELLLRPANATIISKAKDGTVMVNNHFFNRGK